MRDLTKTGSTSKVRKSPKAKIKSDVSEHVYCCKPEEYAKHYCVSLDEAIELMGHSNETYAEAFDVTIEEAEVLREEGISDDYADSTLAGDDRPEFDGSAGAAIYNDSASKKPDPKAVPSDAEFDEYAVVGEQPEALPAQPEITPTDDPSEVVEKRSIEIEDSQKITDASELAPHPFKQRFPVLLFKNATFNDGVNVTFRKGPKWAQLGLRRGDTLEIADSSDPDSIISEVYVSHVSAPRFIDNFQPSTFSKAHDPRCRTKEGLIDVLGETYGSFDPEKDLVVMVEFVYRKG